MRTFKVVPAIAAAALSIGLLAACGDTSETADIAPVSLLTQDSFAATITDAMVDSGSTHVTVSGSVAGQELKAEGDQQLGATAADSRLSLQLDLFGIAFDLRLIDKVVYANLGPLSQGRFVTVDLTDSSNPLVAQFKELADGADVAQQFEDFKTAIDGLKKGGEPQTIDGVQAQPYVLTVDTSKLPQPAGAPATPDPLEFTIYVGADNLPRRIVADVGGEAFTLDLTQWGKDVDVQQPSDAEISDQSLTDLFAGLSAFTGS